LARSAEETRISDAILAVDEPIRATRCKPNSALGCRSNKSRCLTHDLWEELGNQIHIFLSSVSLADVCNRRVLGHARMLNAGEAESRPLMEAEPSPAPTSTPTPAAAE
jgi:Rrf2 family iron-sulfur cluster assembly transcriptional regulator